MDEVPEEIQRAVERNWISSGHSYLCFTDIPPTEREPLVRQIQARKEEIENVRLAMLQHALSEGRAVPRRHERILLIVIALLIVIGGPLFMVLALFLMHGT